MVNLAKLVKPWCSQRLPDVEISGMSLDSRSIKQGDLFIALVGLNSSGVAFAKQAEQAGAVAIIWEGDSAPNVQIPTVKIPGLASKVGDIAARFWRQPTHDLFTIGITGTDGKTSCADLLAQALTYLDVTCGYVGTLGTGLAGQYVQGKQTTPDAVELQKTLARLKHQGAKAVAIEASSHALDQDRTRGVAFDSALLTNIGRDHLDYHGTIEHYAAAKHKLFTYPGLKTAVLNINDAYGKQWLAQLSDKLDTVAYGFKPNQTVSADYFVFIEDIKAHGQGQTVALETSWGQTSVTTALLGRFNALNLAAVVASLVANGYPLSQVCTVASQLKPVPGRMEIVSSTDKQPLVVVDFAHTPNALEQALLALKDHTDGRLLSVFGCGGDRDPGKRQLMGEKAAQYADKIWVTTDNPRSEAPQAISQAIVEGFSADTNFVIEHNRRQAIAHAIAEAKATDTILIAGKGHEAQQVIGEHVYNHDDRVVARQLLQSSLDNLPETAKLSDLARVMQAELIGEDGVYRNLQIDTRKIARNDVFIALRGARDGHDYLSQAQALGAAAAVVDHKVADVDMAQLIVADTQRALQKAAQAWRAVFRGPVIGVTGSNGKTSVRKILSTLLAAHFDGVLATEGNFNNHLGVPLTLLRLRAKHRAAVIEMGANHHHEISQLAGWAKPSVGIITNAGDAHLEGFGSRDGVAEAKSEIYMTLPQSGHAIINADDAYANYWRGVASHCKKLSFGIEHSADVRATDIKLSADSSRFTLHALGHKHSVKFTLPGRHNIYNALAATAAALSVGVNLSEIVAGLSRVKAVSGRLAMQLGEHGLRVVDDSYNANPNSVKAGLSWLADQPGPRWFVLGDMGELGTFTEPAHQKAGELAKQLKIDALWAVGPNSALAVEAFNNKTQQQSGRWFETRQQLTEALTQAIEKNNDKQPIILVKGSRSAGLEHIVNELLNPTQNKVQPC